MITSVFFKMKKGEPALLPQIGLSCMSKFLFLKHSLKSMVNDRPRAVVCYRFLLSCKTVIFPNVYVKVTVSGRLTS